MINLRKNEVRKDLGIHFLATFFIHLPESFAANEILFQMSRHHALHIFTNDIKFNIDPVANFKIFKIGMF